MSRHGRNASFLHVVPRARAVVALLSVLYTAPLALHAQGARTVWTATQLWSVDGSEGGEPFGSIRDFVVLPDGALWALDYNDQVIRRYSASGAPLPSVSRKGSGPGELRNANGMVVRRDGSVWVNDPNNNRLTVFTANGTFAKHVPIPIMGRSYRWNAFVDKRTGDLIDPFVNMSAEKPGTMFWRRVTATGTFRDTMPVSECASMSIAAPTTFRAETKGKGNWFSVYPFAYGGGTVPDGDGAAWCAAPSASRVSRVRLGGRPDTIARTSLALTPLPVPNAERDSAIRAIEKELAKYATHDFDAGKIPSSKPPIALLSVDDDGRLWVQHTPQYGEASVTFDVHNATGVHLGRVRIPFRPSVEGLPIRARGRDLWMAIRDNDDVLSIAKFRLAGPGLGAR